MIEDLAELYKLRVNLNFEELHLRIALVDSGKLFGHGAPSTLYLKEKLQGCMLSRRVADRHQCCKLEQGQLSEQLDVNMAESDYGPKRQGLQELYNSKSQDIYCT
jgi:hypothetical protein